ncbi:hypothetical protein E6O75_ATG05289 [Venturia nashicola]|uniref:Uncharacterized protein n=1 Tax=Venturia nashicola TaxID=86259 RepID=A0A4Z1NYZ3_9PEZI|nr:hypothetical protein E6O75_ATG05289 [Venturia nashicola]
MYSLARYSKLMRTRLAVTGLGYTPNVGITFHASEKKQVENFIIARCDGYDFAKGMSSRWEENWRIHRGDVENAVQSHIYAVRLLIFYHIITIHLQETDSHPTPANIAATAYHRRRNSLVLIPDPHRGRLTLRTKLLGPSNLSSLPFILSIVLPTTPTVVRVRASPNLTRNDAIDKSTGKPSQAFDYTFADAFFRALRSTWDSRQGHGHVLFT